MSERAIKRTISCPVRERKRRLTRRRNRFFIVSGSSFMMVVLATRPPRIWLSRAAHPAVRALCPSTIDGSSRHSDHRRRCSHRLCRVCRNGHSAEARSVACHQPTGLLRSFCLLDASLDELAVHTENLKSDREIVFFEPAVKVITTSAF